MIKSDVRDSRYPIPGKCVCGYLKVFNDLLDTLDENASSNEFLRALNASNLQRNRKIKFKSIHTKTIEKYRQEKSPVNLLSDLVLNNKTNKERIVTDCDNWCENLQGELLSQVISLDSLLVNLKKITDEKLLIESEIHHKDQKYQLDYKYLINKLFSEQYYFDYFEKKGKNTVLFTNNYVNKSLLRPFTEVEEEEDEDFLNVTPKFEIININKIFIALSETSDAKCLADKIKEIIFEDTIGEIV